LNDNQGSTYTHQFVASAGAQPLLNWFAFDMRKSRSCRSQRKPGVPFDLTGIHANTESYIFFHTVRLMLSLAAPTRIAASTLSPPE
jgi:hypothetical protein